MKDDTKTFSVSETKYSINIWFIGVCRLSSF